MQFTTNMGRTLTLPSNKDSTAGQFATPCPLGGYRLSGISGAYGGAGVPYRQPCESNCLRSPAALERLPFAADPVKLPSTASDVHAASDTSVFGVSLNRVTLVWTPLNDLASMAASALATGLAAGWTCGWYMHQVFRYLTRISHTMPPLSMLLAGLQTVAVDGLCSLPPVHTIPSSDHLLVYDTGLCVLLNIATAREKDIFQGGGACTRVSLQPCSRGLQPIVAAGCRDIRLDAANTMFLFEWAMSHSLPTPMISHRSYTLMRPRPHNHRANPNGNGQPQCLAAANGTDCVSVSQLGCQSPRPFLRSCVAHRSDAKGLMHDAYRT
jgi:hypothetical protein